MPYAAPVAVTRCVWNAPVVSLLLEKTENLLMEETGEKEGVKRNDDG